MLAPRYIPTDLQNLNFEHDLAKHQKKLEQIQKLKSKKKAQETGAAPKANQEARERALKFHVSEKALAIEKDNELLLGRLVEISRKKRGFLLSQSVQGKSLNRGYRQREKNRIASENEAFAKRLLSQQAQFDRRKLENDYEKHIGLVKQIQKLEPTSTRKIKLPPLKEIKKTDEKTEEEKEDQAEAEEKKEKEERERKEKQEKEKREKEEAEQKQKEEKEAQEKKEREEKEKKEKEEAEKKQREEKEAQEKKEQEEKAKVETVEVNEQIVEEQTN